MDAIVERTLRAARAYRRDDLADRLVAVAATATARPLVAFVGDGLQGRTTLVGALAGTDALPTRPDRPARLPVLVDPAGPEGALAVAHQEADGFELGLDQVADLLVGRFGSTDDYAHVEVRTGADPPGPVAMVDPVGACVPDGPEGGAGALGWLGACVGAVLVHDAAQPLTRSELELASLLSRLVPVAAVALTRTDLHPDAGLVASMVEGQLAAEGLSAIHVLSSAARLGQVREVAAWLSAVRQACASGATVLVACSLVVSEIQADFAAERAVLVAADRDGAPESRRDEAGSAPARSWMTVLGDGVVDLDALARTQVAESQQDLSAKVDEALAGRDPARAWPQVEQWLTQEAVASAVSSFEVVNQAAVDLARAVAEAIPTDPQPFEAMLAAGAGSSLADRLDAVDVSVRIDASRKLGSRGLTALRSSYTGMLLGGMLTGLTGITVAAPALVVAGGLFASKSLRDERSKQHAERRQQAAVAARRYLEQVGGVVETELGALVRMVQRELRDRAAVVAEHVARQQAQLEAAAVADATRRAARLADVDAELARLLSLHEQIEQSLAGER